MFEKASRLKLRFRVAAGLITTEDLWTLKLEVLDSLAVNLNKEIDSTPEISFIRKKAVSKESELNKLRFEIVKRVIEVKLAEEESAEMAKLQKAKNSRLDEIIARKEEAALENMSIEDLKKLRSE